MWELIKHGYCLIRGHKRKVIVFYTRDNLSWTYHRCERCDYPLPVDKNKYSGGIQSMPLKTWCVMATGSFTMIYLFAIGKDTLLNILSIAAGTIVAVYLMDLYHDRKRKRGYDD